MPTNETAPQGVVHIVIGTELGQTSVIREIRNAEVVEFHVDEKTGDYVLRARRPKPSFLNDPAPTKFRDIQTQTINLTGVDLVSLQKEAEQFAEQFGAKEGGFGTTARR